MARVYLTQPAEEGLKAMSPVDQKEVARALSFLEDDQFRQKNKADLSLIENGNQVWSLIIGRIWLGFVEMDGVDITVIYLSLLSRFRVA